MNKNIYLLTVSVLLLLTSSLLSQERPNLIWARTTDAAITLDGQLSEPAWAQAESFRMKYGENSGAIGGSGYRRESGVEPSDPMDITFRFLVNGNNLYIAAQVQDSSVGGGLFNQFDGFLMNLRRHEDGSHPAGSFEYFYGWVTEGWADPNTGLPGASPGFFGWASTDRNVWDAVTLVDGITNDDAAPDNGYNVEFMFNLTERGYDVTLAEGDIVEFNISAYDADWGWGAEGTANPKFSGTRTWWQGPWGNGSAYDIIRIYAKPAVTTASGSVPVVGPEVVIPNGVYHPSPVVDGKLDEYVWSQIEGFDLRYGDDDLRASYPGIGPWRSGQYQPTVNGVNAEVVDPADATIKAFFKGNMLYLGVEVRDQAVVGLANGLDMWDGIRFIINDRGAVNEGDHNLERRTLTAYIDTLGNLAVGDYLKTMMDTLAAQAALSFTGNTVMNDYNDVDEGYSMELALDLSELGYPVGLGDGALLFSATLFDGDQISSNPEQDYGNRVWFFRESDWPAAPAWGLMDAGTLVPTTTGLIPDEDRIITKFEIVGNYPNPFNPVTRIVYTLPNSGNVHLRVYNVLGQLVFDQALGYETAGYKFVTFSAPALSSGLYFYNLEFRNGNKKEFSKTQRMILVK